MPVGGFSRREALSYLSAGLADYTDQRIEALDLGKDLDGLPIALAQAAAVMNANRLSCQEYRAQLSERRKHMSGPASRRGIPGGPGHLVAGGRVRGPARARGAGLAGPGPDRRARSARHARGRADQPGRVRLHRRRPSGATGADQTRARAAITNLARAGLVSIDAANPVRTVRIHRSVQTAVRAYLPPADPEQVVARRRGRPGAGLAGTEAAARRAGPRAGPARQRAAAVPAARLARRGRRPPGGQRRPAGRPAGPGAGPDALWQPEAHPLLFRLG